MDIIREAGWGIWPVLGFGLWGLVMATRHALMPRAGGVTTVGYLIAMTLMAGVFGTVLGVQVSAEHIGEVRPDERWIFLLGLKESLQNMVMASLLILASLGALLVAHLRGPGAAATSAVGRRAARV